MLQPERNECHKQRDIAEIQEVRRAICMPIIGNEHADKRRAEQLYAERYATVPHSRSEIRNRSEGLAACIGSTLPPQLNFFPPLFPTLSPVRGEKGRLRGAVEDEGEG